MTRGNLAGDLLTRWTVSQFNAQSSLWSRPAGGRRPFSPTRGCRHAGL